MITSNSTSRRERRHPRTRLPESAALPLNRIDRVQPHRGGSLLQTRVSRTLIAAAALLVLPTHLDALQSGHLAAGQLEDRVRVTLDGAVVAEYKYAPDQMEVTAAEVDLDFILNERGRELFGEVNRWYDLTRTGKFLERVLAHNPKAAACTRVGASMLHALDIAFACMHALRMQSEAVPCP